MKILESYYSNIVINEQELMLFFRISDENKIEWFTKKQNTDLGVVIEKKDIGNGKIIKKNAFSFIEPIETLKPVWVVYGRSGPQVLTWTLNICLTYDSAENCYNHLKKCFSGKNIDVMLELRQGFH